MKRNAGMKMSGATSMAVILLLTACGGEGSNSSAGNTVAGGVAPSPNPTATPTPNPSPAPSPSPTPTGGTTVDDRQTQMLEVILQAHNDAREEVGVDDLVLDDDLNAQALAYAEELAETGSFEHSTPGSRPNQGENLWAGTQGAFSYATMAAGWVDEKQYYIHARFPFVSNTGQWQDVGHYTQIIWRDTTRLGCGIATGSGRDYLVCRYSPPGNVSGQFAY